MFCIVGLGNPGEEYENTRHNVGWRMLYDVVSRNNLSDFVDSKKYAGSFSEGMLHGVPVGLLLPMTFMNNSGSSVQKYLNAHNIPPASLIVIYDDVDLPLGDMRISFDRGAGGHNGIKSIIDACGQEFIRIRVGVAKKGIFGNVKRPKGDRLSDFVLGIFTKKEETLLEAVSLRIEEAIQYILKEGVSVAMNKIN